jgi:hypothetical protein
MASRKNAGKRGGGSSIGSALFWLLTRLLLPLGLVYAVLWWRTDVAIERALESLRPFMEIRRGSTVLGLNGDVGIRRLVIEPKAGSPVPAIRITADRAVVRTPGIFWVLRSAVLGVPDEIPSRFGFSLSGAGIDGSPEAIEAAMVGGHVMFPFELAGCEPAMSMEVANALGLGEAEGNFAFTMEYGGASHLRLRIEAETPEQAMVTGDVSLGLGSGGDPSARLLGAGFESATFVVEDKGFGARRNAYCAKKLGVSTEAFVERHLQAVRDRFAADGLVPGAAMDQAYAGFALGGGKLTIQARPLRPGPLVQMQGVKLENLGMFMDASVKHNDNFAAPLVFLSADQFAPAAAPVDAAAAADAATTMPQAADAAAEPAPAPDAATGALAAGSEIPYEDLPKHIGAEVEVSTNIGTVRRGVLTGASSISIVIKLAAEEGGFPLSMPKTTIVKVRLAPPLTETPEPQDNAQAQ